MSRIKWIVHYVWNLVNCTFQARKLYYQPTTGTYYEYDERTKTHKVHSRVDISQYTGQNYNFNQQSQAPNQQPHGQQHRPPFTQSYPQQNQQFSNQYQQQNQQQPNSEPEFQKTTTRKIDMFGEWCLELLKDLISVMHVCVIQMQALLWFFWLYLFES